MLSDEDILLIDTDLSADKMEFGYEIGCFEWSHPSEPCVWWCPAERFVLFPNELKVSKSMRKVLAKQEFSFSINQNFAEVLHHCANIHQRRETGSWLTPEYESCILELHTRGLAKSVEVWQDGKLVGGLYGIEQEEVFCGESMFSHVSNASKAGFIWFVQNHQDQFKLIDCQIYSEHLESLGAREIPRKEFLSYLSFYQ